MPLPLNRWESHQPYMHPREQIHLKIAAITKLGGKLVFAGSDCVETELLAIEHADKNKATYVAPYNDPEVIAGQGTLGLEISNQLGSVDAVFFVRGVAAGWRPESEPTSRLKFRVAKSLAAHLKIRAS